jgi:hypothetical protein
MINRNYPLREFVKYNLPAFTILKGLNVNNRR